MKNIYENALKRSTEKTVISYKKHKKQLKATAISVCLATIIATSIFLPALKESKDDFDSMFLSSSIGSLAQIDNKQSILSKNTKRTNDNKHSFYNLDQIAEDILKVDATYFDVTLYNTYNNMIEQNKNIDELIYSITSIVKDSKEEYPELYYKLNGIETFNDYLIKMHFVNENGTPSIEKYKNYGRTLENIYEDVLKQEEKTGEIKK